MRKAAINLMKTWALGAFLAAGMLPAPQAAEAQADPEGEHPAAQVFRAKGTEPGWSLEITAMEIAIQTADSEKPVVVAKPPPESDKGKTVYAAKGGPARLRVTIEDLVCPDTMSGMPHPKTVTVELNGKTLKGWGGDPLEILAGGEWRVAELNGKPLLPDSVVTIQFDRQGRISGAASVNRYFGAFKLTGEGLSFPQPIGSTMMAGDENLMAQEAAFHQTLGAISRFKIGPDGALLLESPKEGSIKAYRAREKTAK